MRFVQSIFTDTETHEMNIRAHTRSHILARMERMTLEIKAAWAEPTSAMSVLFSLFFGEFVFF